VISAAFAFRAQGAVIAKRVRRQWSPSPWLAGLVHLLPYSKLYYCFLQCLLRAREQDAPDDRGLGAESGSVKPDSDA
jgi:hypothetical protein